MTQSLDEELQGIKDRYVQLPVSVTRRLTDVPNRWMGVLGLTSGTIKPAVFYERYEQEKREGREYSLAGSMFFPSYEQEDGLIKPLIDEHLEKLDSLTEEANEMVVDKNIDLERLSKIYTLVMVLSYGKERQS